MTKTHLQIVALAALLSTLGVVSGAGRASQGPTHKALEEVAGYKRWPGVALKPSPPDFASLAG